MARGGGAGRPEGAATAPNPDPNSNPDASPNSNPNFDPNRSPDPNSNQARQQDELAKVVGAQAELHALELKDEIAFFKDRYKELALIFAHGEPHQQGRASLGGARGGGARGGARRESLGHGLGEVAGGVGHVVGSFVGGISSAFQASSPEP